MSALLDKTNDFSHKVKVIDKDFTLNALDRCDRCSMQAYVDVTLTNSGQLLFCAHHYTAQAANLLPLPSVISVRDESGRLHLKPAPPKDD